MAVCNTIFVALPQRETVTLRKLEDTVTLDDLKAKLELLTGIHGNAMHLYYGDKLLLQSETLTFNDNIRNGGIVKLLLSDQVEPMYDALCTSHVQNITHLCMVTQDDGKNDVTLEAEDKIFFCLLATCRQGNEEVLRILLNLDLNDSWNRQTTQFGRTLVHIAAASGQAGILEILLDHNARIHVADCLQETPLDIAIGRGTAACERLIRQAFMRKKSAKRQNHIGRKNAKPRVCWNEPKNKSNLRVMNTGSILSVITTDSGISGTSLGYFRNGSSRIHNNPSNRSAMGSFSKSSGFNRDKRQSSTDHPKSDAANISQKNHKNCAARPPFIAFRSVTKEELRPVSVEYVPLQQNPPDPRAIPKAPCSSLNSSTEDLTQVQEREKILQKRQNIMKKYSNVKGTSCRSQSAKYYRTHYHIEAEYDGSIPRARPETAGPRYREWKTWLLDKMAQDEEKAIIVESNKDRTERNNIAYNKWVSRHPYQAPESDDDSSDADNHAENDEAYHEWMENKKDVFVDMDKMRKEYLTGDMGSTRLGKNKTITIFELGACGGEPITEDVRPERYMRSYQSWVQNRKRYENWKRRKGLPVEQAPMTREELVKTRDALILQGMTHGEWLGLKAREMANAQLHVHKFQ